MAEKAEKQAPNKALLIVGGLALFAAAGWFAWQRVNENETPPAPSKAAQPSAAPAAAQSKAAAPAAPKANPDKMIEDVLLASGLDSMLRRLPEQILEGVRQAGRQDKSGKLAAGAQRELERLTQEAFTAQGFKARVTLQLKKNFDEKRFREFLGDSSTPLAMRMTELEKKEPKPEEMAAFMASLAAKPLASARAQLIERIDTASRADELAMASMLAVMKGLARGAGADAKQLAEIEKSGGPQRAAVEENLRNAVRAALAYAYRDVSDADLAEYARMHEKESTRFFLGLVFDALIDELHAGAERMGAGLGRQDRPKSAAGADAGAADRPGQPSAQGAKKPAEPDVERPAAKAVSAPSRAHLDARECLRLEANRQVMGCAERFR